MDAPKYTPAQLEAALRCYREMMARTFPKPEGRSAGAGLRAAFKFAEDSRRDAGRE